MGNFEIAEEYSIGSTKILIIAQIGEYKNTYIGVFENDDKLYIIYNIDDPDKIKKFIDSFDLTDK